MGVMMGTSKGDDWRALMSIIRGRKCSVLFALLLVTVGFMTYSFRNTFDVDPRSYHGITTPQGAVAESQHPQPSPTTSERPLVSESPSQSFASNGSFAGVPASNPLVTSSVTDSTKSLSAIGPSPTPLGGGVPLRVMFLGASVTRGDVSVGNLGFRSPLRDKLAALGNPVNFVGSQRLGAFKDNDLEAYPGNRIDQIHDRAIRIVPSTKPNVFVIHVGSNDCLQKHDTANAGKRMRDLINYLFKMSPHATIVMSTLLTNTVPSKEPCILDINIQIRKLASALMREGRPVVLAEMHCEQGLPDRPLPIDISGDGTHPFDHGYGLMADIFFSAFVEADSRGFFKTPEENGVPDDGELERADEPFIYEPEPPKTRPAPPIDKNVPKKPEDSAKDIEAKIKDGLAKQNVEPGRPKPEVLLGNKVENIEKEKEVLSKPALGMIPKTT